MNKITTSHEERELSMPAASRERVPLLRKWWFWAVILGLVAGAYFLFGKSEDVQQPPGKSRTGRSDRDIPVTGVAAKTADIEVYQNGLGTVTPMNVVTVRARVDGQLVRVLFREGQMV